MKPKHCETERGRRGNAIQTSSRAIFRSSSLPEGSSQLALNPKSFICKKRERDKEGEEEEEEGEEEEEESLWRTNQRKHLSFLFFLSSSSETAVAGPDPTITLPPFLLFHFSRTMRRKLLSRLRSHLGLCSLLLFLLTQPPPILLLPPFHPLPLLTLL